MSDPSTTYTPLFDWVLRATGDARVALTYGIVWRYAQRRDGDCHASCAHLAEALGCSRQSVLHYLSRLRAEGLIRCTNPAEPGVARRYLPVSQQEWRASSTVASGTIAEAQDTPPVQSPYAPRADSGQPPVQEAHRGCPDPIQPPVERNDTRNTRSETIKIPAEIPGREGGAAGPGKSPPPLTGSQMVLQLTGRLPAPVLCARVDAAVPPGTPLSELRPYCEAWCARGYNPGSLAWLFEWYAARGIPAARAVPAAQARPVSGREKAASAGTGRRPFAGRSTGNDASDPASPEVWVRWSAYQKAVMHGEDPDAVKRRLGL